MRSGALKLGYPRERYTYRDTDGSPVYHVCRFEPQGEDKTFRQCKPDGLTWDVKGLKLVLYNLQAVNQVNSVALTEGEQCTNAFNKLNWKGVAATCNPGGAGKLPGQVEKYDILAPLKGKSVVIFADNDKAGIQHAEQAAELLYGKAKQVKIINFPELPEKGDVYDFVKIHGEKSITLLTERIAAADEWKPEQHFFSWEDLVNQTFEKHQAVIDHGILPYNGHALIAGETGVGKSLLRQEAALHVAMGWAYLGFNIPKARRVAVFQWENPERTEQARIKKMMLGLGIQKLPSKNLVYAKRNWRPDLTLKGDRKKLLERVKETEAEVIFYDCLSNMHSSDENKNSKLREIVDILSDINAELGTSCILIHHFGKGDILHPRRSIDRIRGAVSLVDWSMTAITFLARPHRSRILRQIEFVKIRDGAPIKPLLVERDENFLLELTYEDSLCPPSDIKKILESLGGRADNQKELMSAVMADAGCSDRSAKKFIRRAVEMKVIKEINRGSGRAKSYEI